MMTARRCVACLSPVTRSWHRLCWRCHRWHLFGLALARLRAASHGLATRSAREVRA